MKVGDAVWITARSDPSKFGFGLYLGPAYRGVCRELRHSFLWKGRYATFDGSYWYFEVISESR